MKTKTFLLLLMWLSIFKLGLAQQPQPDKADLRPINPDIDANWEFIKVRLFDGETKKVLKYSSDIHIRLTGTPMKTDSAIVVDLIEELRKVISTNKIILVNTGGNLVLNFNNEAKGEYNSYKSMTGIGNRYDRIRAASKRKTFPDGVKSHFAKYDTLENDYSSVNFNFNDSISISDRKKYIEYEVLHSLCVVKIKGTSFSPFNSRGPILGKPYWNNDPLKTEFTDKDKFLLTKLYSPDLQEQFKDYMIKSRSWLSYMSFVNKTFLRSIGISVGIILAVIILLVSYKPIFRWTFRSPYLNYLVRGIVISISVFLIQFIYQLFNSQFIEQLITSSWSGTYVLVTFLNMIIAAFYVSLLISTPLFFLEKLLIRPKMSRTVQSGLRIFLLLILVSLVSFIGHPLSNYWPRQLFDYFVLGIILSIGRGILMFIDYSEEFKALAKDNEISKLKELKAKAEILSLQSRINPHFLYNSLNSIAGLAKSEPAKVEKMALSLSDLFRYSINRKDDHMSTIFEEVNMVRTYLEIEKIRFGEKLSYNIDVDKIIENEQIPKYILQPLVENAVKHGTSNMEGKGEIKITIEKVDNKIVLTVFDNGPAFPEGFVSGTGLQSVYDLLNLICGGDAEVNWQNNPEKFIKITIPVCKP
jgi:two-component system LytT family sensor kinase